MSYEDFRRRQRQDLADLTAQPQPDITKSIYEMLREFNNAFIREFFM